jgi:glycerol-3-phosphate dehydrogenase
LLADLIPGSKKYMKLNSKVVEARWDNDESIWNLTMENQLTKETFKDWAHVFVNGAGNWHLITDGACNC